MERGRGGPDDIFGFGGPFGGFGGLGRPGSLISSFFGGTDPFDDPFFTQPFQGLMGPRMIGGSMFGRSMFPTDHGNLFRDTRASAIDPRFLDQVPPPPANNSKGPIIRELSSDDEEGEGGESAERELRENPRKRSTVEPYVQYPDGEAEEKKSRRMNSGNDFNRINPQQPQSHSFTFASSTVTYGGLNGAYYTSSSTRRTGSDGVTLEESKEADTTTRRATHKISRGLGNKGHLLTRKLNPDGKVDTMQILHNINEDELSAFDEAWKGNATEKLPEWNPRLDMIGNERLGGPGHRQRESRGWALPSTEQPLNPPRMRDGASRKPPN